MQNDMILISIYHTYFIQFEDRTLYTLFKHLLTSPRHLLNNSLVTTSTWTPQKSCPLLHYTSVPSNNHKDYPTAHMASIHKSKITLPACSSSTSPVSQSKGRVPPGETQRLPAALFITSDPRPVRVHVEDTHTNTHTHTHIHWTF